MEWATARADSPDSTRITVASLNSGEKDRVWRDGFGPSSPYFESTRAHSLTLPCHFSMDPEKPIGIGTDSPAMYALAHASFCSNVHFMKNTLQP